MRNFNTYLLGTGLIAITLLVGSALAYSGETDLERQKALQAELEHSVVAPCCWNMTVDQHESGASHEVRDKIAAMVKEGKTKDAILTSLVQEYGERILASPSQNNFLGKFASWLIPIAIAFGLIIVGIAISRLVTPPTEKQAKRTSTLNKKDKSSYWDERVEKDLENLE